MKIKQFVALIIYLKGLRVKSKANSIKISKKIAKRRIKI